MARNRGSRRASRNGDGDGGQQDRRDRISELPDSVLLQILVLLPVVEAVRTSVLSHHWRYVWTRLPSLHFEDDVEAVPQMPRFPDLVNGALRGYADDVDMGDVFIWVRRRASVDDPVRFVATLASLAAHRLTARFRIYLSPTAVNLYPDQDGDEEAVTLRLPCFPRVTELSITFMGVDLRMPNTAGSRFSKLTKLFISSVRFTDGGEGISQVVSLRCPCIQRLQLFWIRGLTMLSVFSQSLVSMILSRILDLEQLLVSAENLRDMLVHRCFVLSRDRAFMDLCVPALEVLFWQDRCPEVTSNCSIPRCLRKLTVAELELSHLLLAGGRSHFTRILKLFEHVDTLRLEFPTGQDHEDQNSLIENVNLPYYSELEFMVKHNRHKFGPIILKLLKKCTYVKKVSLQMFCREVGYIPCASNCDCGQLSVWTDNSITLNSLEYVAMDGFRATQDERSLIYYIMRNAKFLRKVSLQFSLGANPTRRFSANSASYLHQDALSSATPSESQAYICETASNL